MVRVQWIKILKGSRRAWRMRKGTYGHRSMPYSVVLYSHADLATKGKGEVRWRAFHSSDANCAMRRSGPGR